jgi:hypothetical protein
MLLGDKNSSFLEIRRGERYFCFKEREKGKKTTAKEKKRQNQKSVMRRGMTKA